MKRLGIPSQEQFHMPGEFEAHRGCVMIWPVRPGSWPFGGKEAQSAFTQVARAIGESEEVWMLCDEAHLQEVSDHFKEDENIHPMQVETNDAWARDVGPTCLVSDRGEVCGVNWSFNAWGGSFDGLYADWEKDDEAAVAICQNLGIDYFDAAPFVLEGGSIHSDGQGTLLVTEACLLSKGRNPALSKEEIEAKLKSYLGVEKIIWLPRGIYNDETNEHVDNVCAFTKPGQVVLAWTDNKEDPQYPMSLACLETLEREKDARGRKIEVVKLPIPKSPVCVKAEELEGYIFEEGEDQREAGERLAASYVNFYISNKGVTLPQFGDPMDPTAVEILGRCFPDRKIYPIPARAILLGGGNIHCITQQIPAGRISEEGKI